MTDPSTQNAQAYTRTGPSLIPDRLSYTISEACAVTGLGRTSIYAAINRGDLKSVRACGRRLILRSDLEHWLVSSRETA